MSLNVGELVGYLRLDMGDFESGMAKGQALADKLDGKNVDVKVDADTGVAEAKLAAVAASEAKVDEGNKKLAKSGNDAGRGMGALVAAVLLLGPALIPIAAGAAGLAVGFGAMGAAGVLAIVGIVQEMKKGTALGSSYSAMLTTLKGDLTTLGRTAASGTLAPFQQAVADLQTKMPALNGLIGEFSVITGKTAGVLVSGLVAAFLALEPLARDAGVYVLTLSQRFAALMSGPGVVTFGDYVRSVFPQVMQAVESIVAAVFHLVAAIAPLGLGTLGILRTFTDLINALPVDVLAALAQTASSVYLGFLAFKMLSGPLTGLSTALQFVGVSAESAAAGVRSLTIAAGVIGAIIAVATLLFSAHSESVRKDQQATNDYTDALIRSNGAIDANVREMALKQLTDSGAIEDAKALHLNLSQVTDAMLGNVPASRAVGAQMAAMVANTQLSSSAALVQAGHINALSGVLGTSTAQFGTAVQAQKDHAAAMATGTTVTTAQTAAQQALAVKVGTTGAALVLAADAQTKTADTAALATAKMYLENDAAGILKGSLDRLNGKTLSAASAQNSFDSSLVNMGDHVNATGKKITFTTTSIKDMSSASVALRGQLNGQVTNLQAVVEANGGLANSTGKARAQMVTMRQQIIDNAVAHGVNRAAVTAYVDGLLKVPKTLPPTKLDVDKAAAQAKVAAFDKAATAATRNRAMAVRADIGQAVAAVSSLQGYLDRLHSRGITLTAAQQGSANKLLGMAGRAGGGLIGRAGGGLLTGPGTPTSDSITGVDASGTPIVRVSRDEFVVNAASYARNRALVNAINDGRQGFAGGGPVSGSSPAGDGATSADIQALGDRFAEISDRQARTIQTMQRQMAGA